MGQQASLQLPHSQHRSRTRHNKACQVSHLKISGRGSISGEQVERVPSDRASEDTYEMSDDDYREDRSPSTSRTREYAI